MKFKEYQQVVTRDIKPKANNDRELLAYLAMGLVSEAGEVANEVKRLFVNKSLPLDAIRDELGDTLFFLVHVADYFKFDLQNIMDQSTIKMKARKEKYPNSYK